jgi:hypothetical protein
MATVTATTTKENLYMKVTGDMGYLSRLKKKKLNRMMANRMTMDRMTMDRMMTDLRIRTIA